MSIRISSENLPMNFFLIYQKQKDKTWLMDSSDFWDARKEHGKESQIFGGTA
jgi:penicillin-binding protein-related factor A (putative recombinase)